MGRLDVCVWGDLVLTVKEAAVIGSILVAVCHFCLGFVNYGLEEHSVGGSYLACGDPSTWNVCAHDECVDQF